MKSSEYNRLTGILLEMDPSLAETGKEVFEKTEKKLNQLTLSVHCGNLTSSYGHQAALLTAINCGKRSFKGGVCVSIEDVPCILPGYTGKTIHQVVVELGGKLSHNIQASRTLFIGTKSSQYGIYLVFTRWSGGFLLEHNPLCDKAVDFPLGGIMAAALAVGNSFLSAMEIEPIADSTPKGFSLWNPSKLEWLLPEADEPKPQYFPEKLWLLGLGHLGQAYGWTLGMLPFKKGRLPLVTLQDFDEAEFGNFEAGALCDGEFIGIKKTRIVSSYLEARGIKTTIIERMYDKTFIRKPDDPEIMILGLDNAESRRSLRMSDFKGIIDLGLGGNLGTFDLVRFHCLPFAGTPEDIWQKEADHPFKMEALEKLTAKLNDCGYVKGIAVNFVGVFASCIAVSELLKAYHGGNKLIKANISLRQISNRSIVQGDRYGFEFFSGQSELI